MDTINKFSEIADQDASLSIMEIVTKFLLSSSNDARLYFKVDKKNILTKKTESVNEQSLSRSQTNES